MSDDDSDLQAFGKRVRQARERLSLGQAEVAELVGTDVGTISRWERGQGYPQTMQLARLSVVLGESIDYLVLDVAAGHQPIVMPAALLEFLQTEYGRIAQRKAYLPTLLSVRPRNEPTVGFYKALVLALELDDDA